MSEAIKVNIVPNGDIRVLHVSQNDVGRVITLNVSDGTGWYDLTGSTVKLEGTKPSGLGYSVQGTVSEHTVTIITTKDMTDEFGNIASELKISKGDTAIGTANVILSVEKDPHPDWTPDGCIETLVPDAAAVLNDLMQANAEADSNIATMAQLRADVESAAAEADESAQAAASVFAVVGNVAFSVLPNGQVRETWTKS